MSDGKSAARATPMSALAAAARRSAAAMSGRRWSRVEGALTATRGCGKAVSVGARLKVEALSPTRAAMACSISARWAATAVIWALAVESCVWARATSRPVASPPSCRTSVSSRARA